MASDVQETFQLSPEAAEAYEAQFVPAFFAQWVPHLIEAVSLSAGHRVLDVACGTGIVARGAADRIGSAGAVVGLDVNDAMLAVARRIRPDLSWMHGDAAMLPFSDAEFDVVVSQMALMFFPNPPTALREMRRVTKPTGTVGVLIPGALSANAPYRHFVGIVTEHAGPFAGALVNSYFALGDRDLLAGLFSAAGLRVVAATGVVGESRFGSVDEFVSIEVDGTPLGKRLDSAARERILADCRQALAPWRNPDGSLHFPFESNLVVAEP
jgi:ubiquinone/menaquinone biosynthesis C-methylase UbiE